MSATTPIKDRLANYIPVNERLLKFYDDNPNGRVLTAIVNHDVEAVSS